LPGDEPKAKSGRAFFFGHSPLPLGGKSKTASREVAAALKKRFAAPARARKIVMGTAIPAGLGGVKTQSSVHVRFAVRARKEDQMAHVSYSKLRDNLSAYMDEVCNGRSPLVITRRNARSVVLMSEEDYDGLMETVHLLNSPTNAVRLLRSIADAEQDKLTDRAIVAAAKP
jgi:antitoxin YefM